MESGYKKVNPKMRKMVIRRLTLKWGKRVKWSSGYWIHGQEENWERLDIGDYVGKVT